MPDQWGRPTFQDGVSIAQGLRSINQDRTKQNVSKIARQIAENPDWTPGEGDKFTDDELWQGRIMGLSAHMDKLNLETAQMQQKALVYRLEQEEFLKEWKKVSLYQDTDQNKFIEEAYKLFNEHLKNGVTIKALEGNKIEITTPDGTKSVQQAPTAEQINDMALSFTDSKAALAQRIAWDQDIKKINMQQMLKAQNLRDPETGKALGVKAVNLFDKATNSLRPVYVDIKTGNELSADEVKALADNGFITAEEMKDTLDLQKKSFDAQTAQAKLISEITKAKGGDVKITDLEKLNKMIFNYENNENQGQAELATIQAAADVLGYEYKKVSEGKKRTVRSDIPPRYELAKKGGSGGNQGLASADSILETNRKKGKSVSIAKRKPGESIEDYVARTQAKR